MSVNYPYLHTVHLDKETNHKFLTVFNVKKRFFDKNTTESGIIKVESSLTVSAARVWSALV